MRDTLHEHRRVWESKAVLRAVYADYYRRIARWSRPGTTVEIGGGTGNLKAYLGHVIATDIQHAPWLDVVADAQRLPFADRSLANIVVFDVLHHLERPLRFFREAVRTLAPGGRIIVLEPGITPLSGFLYRRFHPEPVDMDADPFVDGEPTPGRDPYLSNQAIPQLMLLRYRMRWQALFPELRVRASERLGLFAYPLSGGFRPWSLLPAGAVPALLAIERGLAPLLGPLLAFRLFVVIERA